MKAIVWTAYGPPDVLQLQEIPQPTPKANEVLIKVHAATVTTGDCELRALKVPLLYRLPLWLYVGLAKPQRLTILGQELAGEIAAIGRAVTCFQPGDQIFAAPLLRFGAYAEYTCLPESYPILTKPANMSYAEAATIPTGGLSALHFLRAAKVKAGEKILINGAGGSIGNYTVQLAKVWGATVTCVDSAPKLAMLRAIGADHVIDYRQTDFTQSGERYDVIIDVVGKSSYARSIHALNPGGRYVLGNPTLLGMVKGWWTSRTTDKRVITTLADYKMADLIFLKELIEAGKLNAVIDKSYGLAQVADAHRYVDQGHKAGHVVIKVVP